MDILQVSKVYREIIKNTSQTDDKSINTLVDNCIERSSLNIEQIRSLIFDYDMNILFDNDFVTILIFIDYMDFYMKHDLQEKTIKWIKEKFNGEYDKINDLPEQLRDEIKNDLDCLNDENYEIFCNLTKKDIQINFSRTRKLFNEIHKQEGPDFNSFSLCSLCKINIVCNCYFCWSDDYRQFTPHTLRIYNGEFDFDYYDEDEDYGENMTKIEGCKECIDKLYIENNVDGKSSCIFT